MEPFGPNDPLTKLLGQARPVEPRPSFVRDLVREARQTPQERGWMGRLKGWLAGGESSVTPLAWAAAAVAMTALVVFNLPESARPGMEVVKAQPPAVLDAPRSAEPEASPLPEVEAQWTTLERVDALVAVQDTSELTDREIAFLLY